MRGARRDQQGASLFEVFLGAFDEVNLVRELRSRLPLYMVPKTIVVRPDVPRSPNGKFDRQLIRMELTR